MRTISRATTTEGTLARNARPPLRVAMVIGTAERGGAEIHLVRLAAKLHDRGIDVHVWFTRCGGPLTDELDQYQVPWEVLRPGPASSTKSRKLRSAARMASRLLRFNPDVVYAWMPGPIMMALPLTALLTRANRIAAIVGQQVLGADSFDSDRPKSVKRLIHPAVIRHTMRRAHAVTINAPHLREEALKFHARPGRITLIPNGVAVPTTIANVEVQPPTAIMVANFNSWKGHDLLLDALALVTVPLQVELVGTGVERDRIEQRTIDLGLDGQVWIAEQPVDVMSELLRAQFAIHPSSTEGLPNAVLEELAAGLPVVATDVGGLSLLIENDRTGHLVPLGDASELASRISQLAASPEYRKSMTTFARERATDFNWANCVDSYLTLFDELVGARRCAIVEPGLLLPEGP